VTGQTAGVDTPSDAEVTHRLEQADAAYPPFAPFADWAAEPLGLGSWDDAAARLAVVRHRTPVDEVRAALDEVLRAAAVDTGAIEGLYAADRGFTLSVARNVISLDQAEVEAGIGFRRSFEAQLAGFELALQLATGDEVVTEAALREVHDVTCAGQDTYRILTPVGVQERALSRGSYKTDPNHVQLADGSFHSYAPVDRVPEEMHRLVTEMRSEAFLAAPAVVQAAFSHQAFTAIHPFADGNGRVARLLASVWLLRAASIPLWVETTDRTRYFDALAAADRGDRQPFLRLITSLSLSLLRELALVIEGGPTYGGPDRDERAAATASDVVAEELALLASRRTDVSVTRPPVRPGDLPVGVDVPAGAVVAVSGMGAVRWERVVSVGIDRRAGGLDRFCLLTHDPWRGDGRLLRQDRFAADEMVPQPSSAARRRLVRLTRRAFTVASAADSQDGPPLSEPG